MRGRVAVSDVHTNLTVLDRIRPTGTELYRKVTDFDAEDAVSAGGLASCQRHDRENDEMAVMMQAFYWDSPKVEKQEHDWWNFVAEKVEDLGKGRLQRALAASCVQSLQQYRRWATTRTTTSTWATSTRRAASKTCYGNRAELEALIAKAHKNGIGLYADMVINHNSGADEEEVNPLDGQKRWTKFKPKSGRFPRDWNCFHPSRYEQVMMEGEENFAGFPHLCHRNPVVYAAMFDYARMLIEELGFDGFRFDFVKGFGAWMIGMLAKYRYVKDGKEFTPYVVGEYWSGERGYRHLAGPGEQADRHADCGVRLSAALQAEGRLRYAELRSAQPDRWRSGRDEAAAARGNLRRQPRHGRQRDRERQDDGLLVHHGA